MNTKENPADLISRGCTVNVLQESTMWFHGPRWLNEVDIIGQKTTSLDEEQVNSANAEILKGHSSCCSVNVETSWIEERVTIRELITAQKILIRQVQAVRFSTEIKCLERGTPLCKDSSLKATFPFMDETGLLRITGRLASFTKAFLHSGFDFAGPILLKSSVGRSAKSYKAHIDVFVCLSVKAFHLELVGSLSTVSFIADLARFKSRRHEVECLYSDNATNFVERFVGWRTSVQR